MKKNKNAYKIYTITYIEQVRHPSIPIDVVEADIPYNNFDTKEEAIDAIEKYGRSFLKYVILTNNNDMKEKIVLNVKTCYLELKMQGLVVVTLMFAVKIIYILKPPKAIPAICTKKKKSLKCLSRN